MYLYTVVLLTLKTRSEWQDMWQSVPGMFMFCVQLLYSTKWEAKNHKQTRYLQLQQKWSSIRINLKLPNLYK